MPKILHLLYPNFTFNFVDLPRDFLALTKMYYDRQCRNCHQQLQNNAICLLCGEVVCYAPRDNCCRKLPGMLRTQHYHGLLAEESGEGELSYHARMFEGGCSIFLIPQTAQIYLIDAGRASYGDSPYRNTLGETFNSKNERKWDNYYMNEETGGAKILENLRKLYFESVLPQKIVQDRMAKSSVIMRHRI